MMKKALLGRMAASVLVYGICGAVSVSGAGKARAQATRLGSVVAYMDRAEVDVNGNSMLLSGGATIDTADGQSIASDTMLITMGRNPVTKKDDVASAVAEGHVRFKTTQNIAAPNTPAQIRTIQGSSDKITWQRFEGKAELTDHVTVSVDDPVHKMIWRDAGYATIDLKAGKVNAKRDANGPQMMIEGFSKAVPAPKETTK